MTKVTLFWNKEVSFLKEVIGMTIIEAEYVKFPNQLSISLFYTSCFLYILMLQRIATTKYISIYEFWIWIYEYCAYRQLFLQAALYNH